jgi:hypothetical protein
MAGWPSYHWNWSKSNSTGGKNLPSDLASHVGEWREVRRCPHWEDLGARLGFILFAATGWLSANIILHQSQWGPGALKIANLQPEHGCLCRDFAGFGTDQSGNPLPVSDFASSAGVDYSGVSVAEPRKVR